MRSVLWANYLHDGKVFSDEIDHTAIFRYVRNLDVICRRLHITLISDMLDFPDSRRLADVAEISGVGGAAITEKGKWLDAEAVVYALDRLKVYLIVNYPRIGLFSNATPDIISELEESLDWAASAESLSAKFNFSVVP